MVLYSVIFMCLALTFYTLGVWSERKQNTLKKWHVYVFWIGLLFDTLGTTIMSKISEGGFKLDFHGVTGLLAIALMFVHAFWASAVLVKNNEAMKGKFHSFSVFVWTAWLMPFISGAIFAMLQNGQA